MARQADRGVPLSTLSPKFLHTNSTSHTWPFSAIAELIDNAYDPDVNASHFWIDKTVVQGKECLTFMDNGNGLTYELMHKMLSFGYSDKTALNGKEPIGIYGNGFKSGSMRLGSDAIVFSKSKDSRCVGMLSQTYLEKINAQQIIVPIVCFEGNDKLCAREEHKASLQDILQYSPFKTVEELLLEVDAISSPPLGKTGTRIIIWNLRRTSTNTTEFDFESDRYDIRIPLDVSDTLKDMGAESNNPECFHKLRAYCSILYLKPRMQIVIRGQKVKTQLIAKSLAFIQKDHYKPNFLNKRLPITFGYNTKSKEQYGVMMYHKNRLIKAYKRVGCQLKANNKGVGVIGVIECNFLDPTHNKQSFIETERYSKTITSLGNKLEEYWNEIRYKRKEEDPNGIPVEDAVKSPDQNWVQCDECLKWRKLPDGINCDKLPDKWFCHWNPDPQFRSCHVEEEPEDSDDEQPTYRKTYKQHQREEKKKTEMKRQKEEEEKKHQEEQRLAELTRQNQALKRQLHQKSAKPRSANVTPVQKTVEFSIISQADCRSSNNEGLPVITDVCSLSPGFLRGKRTQPAILQETRKRQKHDGLIEDMLDPVPSVEESPATSPSLLENNNNNSSDTDDDLIIMENTITPKSEKPSSESIKVKMELDQSNIDMLPECGDSVAHDDSTVKHLAGTGSRDLETSSNIASITMCNTTQTDIFKVKKEEPQSQNEGERSQKQVDNLGNSFCVKQQPIEQEIHDRTHGENPEMQKIQKGVMHPFEGINANGSTRRSSPQHYLNMAEPQEKKHQPQVAMQTAAQERDSLKEQVQMLTTQLQEMQDRMKKLMESTVKKEYSHQFSQTEDGKNYEHLFRKLKQKIDELIKDNTFSLTTTQAEPNAVQGEEKDFYDIVQPVEFLIQELKQRNKERDELFAQLDVVENERTKLVKQCEEQNLVLQQRETSQEGSMLHRATGPTKQSHAEETAYRSSLISLRHNISRLLVTFVPALELDQVNYECDVIDEILEQVLIDVESGGTSSLNVKNLF